MAFKMKGFPMRSGFKQISEEEKKKIAEDQDPGSGRSKLAEMRYDMEHTEKEIERFKELAKDNPQKYNRAVGMLSSALEKQKKAYLNIITKYGMVPKP